jgi:hypothetical protein
LGLFLSTSSIKVKIGKDKMHRGQRVLNCFGIFIVSAQEPNKGLLHFRHPCGNFHDKKTYELVKSFKKMTGEVLLALFVKIYSK